MRRLFTFWFGFSVCLAAALHGSAARAEGKSEIKFKRLPEISQPPEAVAQPSEDLATVHEPSTFAQPPAPAPQRPATPPVQSPPAPRPHLGTRTVVAPPFYEPPLPSQTQQALAFYGGHSARATLSQMPRRAPIHPAPSRPLHGPMKPFQNVNQEPTISPYIHLDRDEKDGDLPNYFTYVRPQLEQLQMNQMQQRELQQLRGQVQGMSAGTQYQSMRPVGSGAPARFMDTAQFYGGWR